MVKFNTTNPSTKTVNRAGGVAYAQTPELELASLLLTSFLNDKYYESGKEQQTRLATLAQSVDPLFAAKASVFARTEFGMRSVSHVVAAAIGAGVSGTDWGKRYYKKVIHRPDDITEIMSLAGAKNITHAMRKGFREALEGFDEYQVGKYKGNNHALKLVDAVNLVHAYSPSINLLVKDELKAPVTFETKLSAAGKKENKTKAKLDAWRELLMEKKIGYFALLRNLRNIEEQAPELIQVACELLQDEKMIRKSLVLPFRFMTAYKEVGTREMKSAISKAIDISCANVPKFDGKTLIAIDQSGSMSGQPEEISSLFAAIMYKAMNARILCFADESKEWIGNPEDSVITIAEQMKRTTYGGTSFSCIFNGIGSTHFDRIFILSDMQAWADGNWYGTVKTSFKKYRDQVPGVKLYSFDLQGYGDMQFPEQNVFTAAGWSEKVFDVIKQLESGKDLVKQINEVEI